MKLFISKKKHKVEKLIFEYLDNTSHCLKDSETNFTYFLTTNSADDDFYERVCRTHTYESKSDDKRKEIEYMMYDQSLIPESRGDVLGLLEAIDRIPNRVEVVLREIYMADIKIPNEHKEDFRTLFAININAAKLTLEVAYKYFDDPSLINEYHQKIDRLESDSDVLQIKLTREIMTSALETLDKLVLKDFIVRIGQISDRAENVADRLKILSVKTIF